MRREGRRIWQGRRRSVGLSSLFSWPPPSTSPCHHHPVHQRCPAPANSSSDSGCGSSSLGAISAAMVSSLAPCLRMVSSRCGQGGAGSVGAPVACCWRTRNLTQHSLSAEETRWPIIHSEQEGAARCQASSASVSGPCPWLPGLPRPPSHLRLRMLVHLICVVLLVQLGEAGDVEELEVLRYTWGGTGRGSGESR